MVVVIREGFRFIIVGVGSNLINFFIYSLLYSVGFSLVVAAYSGYLVGALFSFHFCNRWVFPDKAEYTKAILIKFLILYFFSGIGMTVITAVSVNEFAIDYKFGWLLGAFFAFLNNFIGSKNFVFRNGLI